MKSRKVTEIILMLIFFLVTVKSSIADCNCSPWLAGGTYAGGYCVDHIQDKMTAAGLGSRPTGNAGTWTGNIEKNNVQVGDVAIFDVGTYGHVAWTEEITSKDSSGNPTEIRISEKNYGGTTNDPVKNCCGVTTMYNIVSERIISVSSVDRFWHPPGVPLPYLVVGNVAWYPPNKSCVEAERWRFFSCGYPNCGQTLGSNDICYDQEDEMRAALGVDSADWYLIIYGTEDLDKVLTCHQ